MLLSMENSIFGISSRVGDCAGLYQEITTQDRYFGLSLSGSLDDAPRHKCRSSWISASFLEVLRGVLVASAGEAHTASMWDVSKVRPLRVLVGHPDQVNEQLRLWGGACRMYGSALVEQVSVLRAAGSVTKNRRLLGGARQGKDATTGTLRRRSSDGGAHHLAELQRRHEPQRLLAEGHLFPGLILLLLHGGLRVSLCLNY